MIVPMRKGESGHRYTNWYFDSRVSTDIGLGVSGTCVQYDNSYSLTPALICEETAAGLVAVDFTSVIGESDDIMTNSRMASEIQEFVESCSTETLINTYNLIFGAGSAVQNTQLTASEGTSPYFLRPFGKKYAKLTTQEFINRVNIGDISADEGYFFYAVAAQETTIAVNLYNINEHWPFVIWYKDK